MNVLLRTGVDTRLARPFLRGGGHGVLLQAKAEYPEMRDPAPALLRALRGCDYGADIERWHSWVESL